MAAELEQDTFEEETVQYNDEEEETVAYDDPEPERNDTITPTQKTRKPTPHRTRQTARNPAAGLKKSQAQHLEGKKQGRAPISARRTAVEAKGEVKKVEKRRMRPGQLARKKVLLYQKITKPILPFANVCRIIRSIMAETSTANPGRFPNNIFIQAGALKALRVLVEEHLRQIMNGARVVAHNAGHQTVNSRDFLVAKTLQSGRFDLYPN